MRRATRKPRRTRIHEWTALAAATFELWRRGGFERPAAILQDPSARRMLDGALSNLLRGTSS